MPKEKKKASRLSRLTPHHTTPHRAQPTLPLSPQNMHADAVSIINNAVSQYPPCPPACLATIITSLQIAAAAEIEGAAASSSKQLVMEIVESVKCECCGLREDCTQDYIAGVRASFYGQWLCGLCCEAVRDEASRKKQQHHHLHPGVVEEAVRAHMAFCRMFRSNPAVRVADGMRQMLRRRSGDLSKPAVDSSSKYGAVQVGDDSSVCHYISPPLVTDSMACTSSSRPPSILRLN